MNSVLLVGCGNIGFRHLQALSSMSTTDAAITVVEPNLSLHPRIREHFDVSQPHDHHFALRPQLPADTKRFDLVVVATTAETRRSVTDQIFRRYEVSTAILEKVLFQTTQDLEAVGTLFEQAHVNAFVNCGRRTFRGYQDLRARFANTGPVHVRVSGQSFGLASNAVHFLDLAEYLNSSPIVDLDLAGLSPGTLPSKRDGCIELSGNLSASLANGAQLIVECADAEPVGIEVAISAADVSLQIDELDRTVTEQDQPPISFQSQNVSETVGVYEDAIEFGRCELTPYVDSARQHRFFITELRKHLELTTDAPCPIS